MIKTTKTPAAMKPRTKRSLIKLTVTGFNGEFPSAANLETAMQQRAATLGYTGVGAVTIDAMSTADSKIINIVATDIESVRLINILDDVLKTFVNGGYNIELSSVVGPVTMQLSFRRLTKKAAKAQRAAAAAAITTKAAVVAKPAATVVQKAAPAAAQKTVAAAKADVKPTAQKRLVLRGRRTGAYKKLARGYVTKGLTALPTQDRLYNASGTADVTAPKEALVVASFLFAAYGLDASAVGGTITVKAVPTAEIDATDALVGDVVVSLVPGEKTGASLAVIDAWYAAHAGAYVVTTEEEGYYLIGPKGLITDVPVLK